MPDEPVTSDELNYIALKDFFEKTPPGKQVLVKNVGQKKHSSTGYNFPMQLPTIELHCDTESCNGIRFFKPLDSEFVRPKEQHEHFVTFICRNCQRTRKTYAFWSRLSEDEVNGVVLKFGEQPPFGPPTPARLIKLIGPDRDYYLKGRQSENQGLGIAAFAYYRRVIENQKSRIFDEIIRVSKKVGAAQEILDDLKAAKHENQFSKAVDHIKHGVPQALLIDGHNPLSLLHAALSEGLHAETDEQCLELAASIRVVLTELVERMTNALKEEAELTAAVSRLLSKRIGKPKPDFFADS